jgi:N-acetylglucosamine-6-phosphate deacetylase
MTRTGGDQSVLVTGPLVARLRRDTDAASVFANALVTATDPVLKAAIPTALALADVFTEQLADWCRTEIFVDLHCHGGGGFGFDEGAEAVGRALAVHRAHGTTRSVISLVANPVAALEHSVTAIADIAERDPLVLGSHLEGPFLARAAGARTTRTF